MISELGDILTNGVEADGSGSRDVTVIFAVEVGERCKVRGCARAEIEVDSNDGLGRALTWCKKLVSRNDA